MSPRRFRRPRAKPGEVKVQWGKVPHQDPDLVFCWGEGCFSADARLLYGAFTLSRWRPLQRWDEDPEPSLVKELEERGYDLTTLRFSIQKRAKSDPRVTPNPQSVPPTGAPAPEEP